VAAETRLRRAQVRVSVFRVHEFLQIRGVGGGEASEVVNAPGDDAAGAPTSERSFEMQRFV